MTHTAGSDDEIYPSECNRRINHSIKWLICNKNTKNSLYFQCLPGQFMSKIIRIGEKITALISLNSKGEKVWKNISSQAESH